MITLDFTELVQAARRGRRIAERQGVHVPRGPGIPASELLVRMQLAMHKSNEANRVTEANVRAKLGLDDA